MEEADLVDSEGSRLSLEISYSCNYERTNNGITDTGSVSEYTVKVHISIRNFAEIFGLRLGKISQNFCSIANIFVKIYAKIDTLSIRDKINYRQHVELTG